MAPMTPIATLCCTVNPSASASSSVRKMPNWPAAPSSRMRGFSSSGPKSVMAPMPMNTRTGNSSVNTPAL
jgi:hypothetical protein